MSPPQRITLQVGLNPSPEYRSAIDDNVFAQEETLFGQRPSTDSF
jgi:hypothetical protein